MPKLSQIIAIHKGIKSRVFEELTKAHQNLQKTAILAGISRTYTPREDGGDTLPPESTRVQLKAHDVIRHIAAQLTELFDTTATLDSANCQAKANVVVDGVTLATDVPATYLLFLEKQLVDLHTFIKKLPVLDPSESWVFDSSADCWATEPVQTVRTKKVPRNHVKAEATEHHPAQVEVYHEDIVAGYWRTVKFSGALPAREVNAMLDRVDRLARAVKMAREEANSIEVQPQRIGQRLLNYLFDLG